MASGGIENRQIVLTPGVGKDAPHEKRPRGRQRHLRRLEEQTELWRIDFPRQHLERDDRPYVPSLKRRLTLDEHSRVARIGRVEPHTRRASRGAS